VPSHTISSPTELRQPGDSRATRRRGPGGVRRSGGVAESFGVMGCGSAPGLTAGGEDCGA
jgi:hypothetical protein